MSSNLKDDSSKPTSKMYNKRPPSYGELHAQLLPVKTYPLPPLIPHNPLSVLYFAYTYLRQALFPPTSHPSAAYEGFFSSETHSVHVTDPLAVRALWEHGFFGKGNLSRSEPTWLDREKRRRGIIVGETSEEITRKRREERKAFKKERARKLREEIDLTLKAEVDRTKTRNVESDDKLKDSPSEQHISDTLGMTISKDQSSSRSTASQAKHLASRVTLEAVDQSHQVSNEASASIDASEVQISNEEHLQLDLFEAFFLTYALGVLKVYSPDTNTQITTRKLFPLLLSHASFPPLPNLEHLKPDNTFLLSYIAYHHFRSVGWVVRLGTKFAVDFLLYNRGPVFSHAEFAIVVLPAYSHPYWKEHANETSRKGKPWHWLHMISRVQSQVKKSLVLCFVEVPPPWPEEISNEEVTDIGKILKKYKVRELVLKRWVPNRTRD